MLTVLDDDLIAIASDKDDMVAIARTLLRRIVSCTPDTERTALNIIQVQIYLFSHVAKLQSTDAVRQLINSSRV